MLLLEVYMLIDILRPRLVVKWINIALKSKKNDEIESFFSSHTFIILSFYFLESIQPTNNLQCFFSVFRSFISIIFCSLTFFFESSISQKGVLFWPFTFQHFFFVDAMIWGDLWDLTRAKRGVKNEKWNSKWKLIYIFERSSHHTSSVQIKISLEVKIEIKSKNLIISVAAESVCNVAHWMNRLALLIITLFFSFCCCWVNMRSQFF